jgi:cutinase
MSARRIAGLLGSAMVTWAAVLGMSVPVASAQAPPCPDVEVIFARGTNEAPGVGGTGQAFVDALIAQAAPRSVGVYPVNYPASSDFGDRIAFARTVVDGVRDAGSRVISTAANCPNTRIVLGGFSQGAVVAGYVTSERVPDAIPAEYLEFIPKPLDPEVAENVAAVVLLGKPSDAFIRDVGAPPIVIGPLYADKTLQLCAPGDTICDGSPVGGPNIAHAMYAANGLAAEGAAYVVGRL